MLPASLMPFLKEPPTKSQTPPRHPMTNFNPGDIRGGVSSPTQWRVCVQPPKDHPVLHLGPAWFWGTCGSVALPGTWVSTTPSFSYASVLSARKCFLVIREVPHPQATIFRGFDFGNGYFYNDWLNIFLGGILMPLIGYHGR